MKKVELSINFEGQEFHFNELDKVCFDEMFSGELQIEGSIFYRFILGKAVMLEMPIL